MVSIQLYNYRGRRNTVNKQLGDPLTLSGTLKDDFNYLNPTITVRLSNLLNSNYCYISNFNRYYFIDDIIVKSNGAYDLLLSVDILKTYETDILTATGETVLTADANPYSSNRDSTYNLKPQFEKIPFPETGLLDPDGTIIMVTIKGGKYGSN